MNDREQGADARKDAATDKRDADYAMAKEKCDAFTGDANTSCLSEAKAGFGKSDKDTVSPAILGRARQST